jgi:Fe-S oxidoreductase
VLSSAHSHLDAVEIQERARQILETDAEVVAVGCPFCMTMLEDGINARKGDRDLKVKDVATSDKHFEEDGLHFRKLF